MAKNQRAFQDGVNHLGSGFIVDVVRFTSAFDSSESGRTPARHWGTITTPDGEVISMGDKGMTTPEIKKKINSLSGSVVLSSRTYNRGGSDSVLKSLESARKVLLASGLDVTEVDSKIQSRRDELDAQRCLTIEAENNRVQIKAYEKEIKKLEKVKSQISALGLSTTEIDDKISAFRLEIAALSD